MASSMPEPSGGGCGSSSHDLSSMLAGMREEYRRLKEENARMHAHQLMWLNNVEVWLEEQTKAVAHLEQSQSVPGEVEIYEKVHVNAPAKQKAQVVRDFDEEVVIDIDVAAGRILQEESAAIWDAGVANERSSLDEAADQDVEVATSEGADASLTLSPRCSISSKISLFRSKTVDSNLSDKSIELAPKNDPMSGVTGGKSRTRWMSDFFEDPLFSPAAAMYRRIMFGFTLLCVSIPVFQTLDPPPLSRKNGFAIEASVDTVFSLELLIRFGVCVKRLQFFQNVGNLLDLTNLAILGLRTFVFIVEDSHRDCNLGVAANVAQTVLFCVAPILRLVKALRAFPNLRLLFHAFSISSIALTVPLFMLLLMVFVFSISLYLVEPRSNIETLPHAIYLVVITLSTVGYGDTSPETDLGRLICCIIAVCGVMYMAMPITIVGDAFTHTWKDRGRIILIGRTRERLVEWGFTDTDLGTLFKWFDRDGSGTIDIEEFSYMISKMRLGLSQSSIEQLFNVFDKDVSGEIDLIEFKKSMRLPTVGELTHVGQLTLHSDVEDDQ
mmetsp:Transcript_63045/g.135369  ORF Transcript_63045/g.135369 Transcript_63045/m.135369 type:complete len:553 (+) Transcript_63045:144-1802(+)